MKVLHISTVDYGGAGHAAYELHKFFINEGHNSKMLVFKKSSRDENVIEFKFPYCNLLKKAKRKIHYEYINKINIANPKYNFFNYSEISNYIPSKVLIKSFPFSPDIIIFHWITHFINYRNIFEIYNSSQAQLFWNLLDMAPMTGGCHYAWDCNGYQQICGKCPALGTRKNNDKSRRNFTHKLNFIKGIQITIITPSSDLNTQKERSSLFRNKVSEKILLAVDEKKFFPGNKVDARNIFNLPINSKIIFVGSQIVKEERKGYFYLLDTLEKLKRMLSAEESDEVVILLAGKSKKKIELPFSTKFVGLLNEKLLTKAYQAADLFLCTSIEDSGPIMINESIMSGLPVVSFNIGVAPDLIISDRTGYLAALKNTDDLANGVKKLISLSKSEILLMSNNCRTLAEQKIRPDIQVGRFINLTKR